MTQPQDLVEKNAVVPIVQEDLLREMMEPSEEVVKAAHAVWWDHEQRRLALAGGSGDLAHQNWETHYWQAMLRAFAKSKGLEI